jgi:neutral ceramidase
VTLMLYLGAAEKKLSPPKGLYMAGYADRELPSEGMHDELFVRAVFLANGDQDPGVFVVSCDLLDIPLEWRSRVRQRVRESCSLPGLHVVLVSTHTHAAPDVQRPSPAEQYFAESVLKTIELACYEAYQVRSLCRGWAFGSVDVPSVGSVRRLGKPASLPLTVHTFYTDALPGESPRAAIVHFPCHPTILSAENRLYSAEYPGVVARQLREVLGDTVVCFLNGAAGDISTRFTRRNQTFQEVERIGGVLAKEALRRIHHPEKVGSAANDTRFEVAERDVTLFPQPAPDSAVLSGIESRLERTAHAGTDDARAHRIRHTLEQAVQVWRSGGYANTAPTTVQLTAVSFPGCVDYVFWPGEPFSGYATALQNERNRPLVLVGYAGAVGYLPDVDPHEDVSYEVLMSQYGRVGGQRLLDATKDLLRALERGEEPS